MAMGVVLYLSRINNSKQLFSMNAGELRKSNKQECIHIITTKANITPFSRLKLFFVKSTYHRKSFLVSKHRVKKRDVSQFNLLCYSQIKTDKKRRVSNRNKIMY